LPHCPVACVIARWSYGLIRDTGAILLDMNPDRTMAGKLRHAVKGEGDQLADLHLWRLGPGHLGAIVSVVTVQPREANYHKSRLARFPSLSHLTVEVTAITRLHPSLYATARRDFAAFAPEALRLARADAGAALERGAWILERSATGLREADLNVLSKLGNQGLEGRLEPEAFTGGEVGGEDDLLDVLVGCPVYI
jgi:muconolactone delta-isomerase